MTDFSSYICPRIYATVSMTSLQKQRWKDLWSRLQPWSTHDPSRDLGLAVSELNKGTCIHFCAHVRKQNSSRVYSSFWLGDTFSLHFCLPDYDNLNSVTVAGSVCLLSEQPSASSLHLLSHSQVPCSLEVGDLLWWALLHINLLLDKMAPLIWTCCSSCTVGR